MRLGLLTSVDTRHRYFARALRAALPVAAVGYERTGYSPARVENTELAAEQAEVVAAHFAERSRQEALFFGHDSEFLSSSGDCGVLHIEPGALNGEGTAEFLTSAGVDTVAVYGTNLIKPPLLGLWSGRMINMHLGLSPYYRGTATNFYPLLNEEPEYVGATIHVLDIGIDSGPILRHARPDIVADDQPHTIGCKAILAGIDAFIAVLNEFDCGTLSPTPQWPVADGKLYLRKDYHPRQVVELYQKLERGLIADYVKRAASTPRRVKLVE